MIASLACMLSFGRKNYEFALVDYILVYPGEFYSAINDRYHKGEFNPREKALVLSWKDFEEGYQITNDKRNLGIHEFMHAMQLESKSSRDLDSNRFAKQFQNILKRLTHPEIKAKLEDTQFLGNMPSPINMSLWLFWQNIFLRRPRNFRNCFQISTRLLKKCSISGLLAIEDSMRCA